MKDIMLKITGKTIPMDSSEPDDVVEFVTEGKLYNRGQTVVIAYPETELSGMEGCTTKLTISKKKVRMVRTGDPLAVDTVMEFEKGKRFHGLYDTPYGTLGMELLTNSVSGLTEASDGSSSLSIDYSISLQGIADARKTLDIKITDRN